MKLIKQHIYESDFNKLTDEEKKKANDIFWFFGAKEIDWLIRYDYSGNHYPGIDHMISVLERYNPKELADVLQTYVKHVAHNESLELCDILWKGIIFGVLNDEVVYHKIKDDLEIIIEQAKTMSHRDIIKGLYQK